MYILLARLSTELTRCDAASATPCAWLPAEEQMTPRRSCSADSDAILLYAPRSLNENTCGAVRPGSKQLQPQHGARSAALASGRMLPVFYHVTYRTCSYGLRPEC